MSGHPAPFHLDEDDFVAGEGILDVDPIFAKTFERVMDEMRRDAPLTIVPFEDGEGRASLLAEGLWYHDVPAGVLLCTGDGTPVGGYLDCDLSLASTHHGRGLGAEIVIERCLRDGAVPTWNLDQPAYSPAGLAAHRAAWRRARRNPEETMERMSRW